ncbi:MAG: hypothetical protein QG654_150 [Patescibacteria group bacterium]|jgi:membrane-bound inhibitor of C-type lysozyme|nr:hypothetical protein [Patescibacteria group bacterium]
MKNIVWVILGVIAVAAIVFVSGKNKANDTTINIPVENDKVFVDATGQELRSKSDLSSSDVTFGPIGKMTLGEGKTNLSGTQYTSADGTIIFLDKGPSAVLYQNGTVIFDGMMKEPASN